MNLTTLNPEFRERLEALVEACAERGVIMKPYSGLRDCVEQGKLWRQSRPSWQVRQKIAWLEERGAHYLAECLDKAGPTSGPHVTNAYGGLSWHNFGEAADCYWQVDGRANWSTTEGGEFNGYRVYGALAERYGLTSLGHTAGWDWVHVQLRPESSPAKVYDILEVNDHLQDFAEERHNPLTPHRFDGLLV